jgi:HTH-type transcriptional regulator / antitoxin HigA
MLRKFNMNIRPVKTKKDYEAALKRIDQLFNAKPNTPSGDELEILVTLVEVYENKKFNIAPPDPVEAIKFRMEQLGLKQSDLAETIGGKNRASEILNGKRELTVKMMRELRKKYNIPAESLLS